ncbi:MAG: N-acetyltransferase family protein [Crocinitomicaceae bacterium]
MNTITIKQATERDSETIARLGSTTYVESHGSFIENKNDLSHYIDSAFSHEKTTQELHDRQNLFYLIFTDDLPIGYAKLVQNSTHECVSSNQACRLERIYILDKYIPLKVGKQFLAFTEEKAKSLEFDTLWLSVYVKNLRAIKFYEKNDFKDVGRLNFIVNGKEYDNIIFSKRLSLDTH